jgi:hypothetical protein
MASLIYLNSKLSDAIYTLTVHEGDAQTRLAMVLSKLLILPVSSFPRELQKDFKWVIETIERGIGMRFPDTPPPSKLTRIQNRTARKVIERIVYIHDEICSLSEDSFDTTRENRTT